MADTQGEIFSAPQGAERSLTPDFTTPPLEQHPSPDIGTEAPSAQDQAGIAQALKMIQDARAAQESEAGHAEMPKQASPSEKKPSIFSGGTADIKSFLQRAIQSITRIPKAILGWITK